MNIFLEPHKHALKNLIEFKVEFMLVGGMAVNYHGFNRATGDMDIWLRPNNENRLRFISYLEADGFDTESIGHIRSVDFTSHAAFHIGEKPLQIDFMTHISGVSYEEANAVKEIMNFEDMSIPVIHIRHLILSKITTGRTKDKADVEELQKIMKLKKGLS